MTPSPSLKLLALTLKYISMNWLLLVSIRARALHIVCACVTVVLGFAAHSFISGTDFDAGTVPRMIAMTAWDTDQISRSSSLSAPTRFRGIYFVYVLREM